MQHMKKMCEDHLHRYVLVTTKDNQQFDGIVEHVDDENLYLAVVMNQYAGYSMQGAPSGFGYGNDSEEDNGEDQRIIAPGFGAAPFYGGYGPYGGFPAYGGYGPYGYPYRRSPFGRLILPLAGLTALSLLPFYF
ncbi:hypothetical protein [Evansella clarkii]|uniref:hypothetical protein n=1 Tax=Evansella clarkii TaxID=79879 RepID=UPI000B4513ED|nr:hypothetical protein [Evansella clarkii]